MNYYDDTPVYKLTDDKLGRAHHSRRLARMVVDSSIPNTSYVIGVYGPWGSGKSSFLNFIKEELDQIIELEKLSIKVETFSPWNFTSSDDLLGELAGLLAPLSSAEQKKQSFFEQTDEHLLVMVIGSFILMLIAYFVSEREYIFKILTSFYALLGLIAARRVLGLTPRDAKARIKDTGIGGQTKTVVFIDEIDRWDRESTRNLMRFIRVNSDLKNIVFILAFDPVIVAQHLTDNNVDGRRYLEKIIQFPYDLPQVERRTLTRYAEMELEKHFKIPSERSDIEDECWSLLNKTGMLLLIENVRQLRQVQNSLTLQLSSIKSEVNVPIFIFFEIIRIRYPGIYENLYQNLSFLLTKDWVEKYVTKPIISNKIGNSEVSILVRWASSTILPSGSYEEEILANQISVVFDLRKHLEMAFFQERETLHGDILVPETREAFTRYFTFSVPQTQLSTTDFERILDNITLSELEKIIFISSDSEKQGHEIAQYRMSDFLGKIVGELKNRNIDPEQIIELVWRFPVESFSPDFEQAATPLSTNTLDSYHPLGRLFFTFLSEAVKWWISFKGKEIDETIIYWRENGIPLSVMLYIFKEEIIGLRNSIPECLPRTLTSYKEAVCGEHILTALDVPYLLKFKPLFFDNDTNAAWANVLGRLLESDEKFITFLERISFQDRHFAEDMKSGPVLRSHFPENLIPELFEDAEKFRSRLEDLTDLNDLDLAERAGQLLDLYRRRGRSGQ